MGKTEAWVLTQGMGKWRGSDRPLDAQLDGVEGAETGQRSGGTRHGLCGFGGYSGMARWAQLWQECPFLEVRDGDKTKRMVLGLLCHLLILGGPYS